MDFELVRAYCAQDLNGILKPSHPLLTAPETQWSELHLLLNKHRLGKQYLQPRHYAAAVCLRALVMFDLPYHALEDCPEYTKERAEESNREMLADALKAYMLHLSDSEARPLQPNNFQSTNISIQHTAEQKTATIETQQQRRARRYQLCLEAGLPMPRTDYSPMPRGIGAIAQKEGITRQALVEDMKAHIKTL